MAERIKYRFVVRRRTAADWTTLNEILLEGEFGLEIDTKKKKMGDGVTAWNDLPYDGGGGQLNTTAPLTGGGPMSDDLTLGIAPVSRSSPGVMEASDKVKLDATHGDGANTQVGATLMQTGSSVATMPSSSSTASKSILFNTPYDTIRGVFIEPGVGSVSSSGDTPSHYVTKSNTGFTVNFKAAANITKDIPFDWMAFGAVAGSGIAALSGMFKRIRIGVAYSSDITAAGGDGTYALFAGTGLYSGVLPAGLTLSIASTNLLRLSGTCTEPSPTTLSGTVAVVTGDSQIATSAQSFDVRDAFDPSELFSAGERGIWLDFNDLSTMFQDTAGTVPVTTVGQSVALVKDKSGNGQDVSQGTLGNRPILQNDGTSYYLAFARSSTQWLERASNTLQPGTQSLHGAAASKSSSTNVGGYVYSRSIYASGVGRYGTVYSATGTFQASSFANQWTASNVIAFVNAATPPTKSVLSAIVDRQNGTVTSRLAQTGLSTQSASVAGEKNNTNIGNAYRFRVGAYGNSSDTGPQLTDAVPWNGAIYGIILRFTDTIDQDTVLDLESWIVSKYHI